MAVRGDGSAGRGPAAGAARGPAASDFTARGAAEEARPPAAAITIIGPSPSPGPSPTPATHRGDAHDAAKPDPAAASGSSAAAAPAAVLVNGASLSGLDLAAARAFLDTDVAIRVARDEPAPAVTVVAAYIGANGRPCRRVQETVTIAAPGTAAGAACARRHRLRRAVTRVAPRLGLEAGATAA